MNLLTRPQLDSDVLAHDDHHEHDHDHEQGGMKVFGMWIGAYFFGGGGRPRFFASWKASSSSALGTTAKL